MLVELTLNERKKGRKCEPGHVKNQSSCLGKTVSYLIYTFDSRAASFLSTRVCYSRNSAKYSLGTSWCLTQRRAESSSFDSASDLASHV